jgi:hypothetical protein
MKVNKQALYWHWPERSCLLNCCNFCRVVDSVVRNVVCPPSGNLISTYTTGFQMQRFL